MSYLTFNNGAAPATPAVGKTAIFVDTADGRVKAKDEKGAIFVLTPDDTKENLLFNGGFNFAQRQVPSAAGTYSNTTGRTYGADRWGITNENASVQYSQVDSIGAVETGLNARYYGKFKKITSAGKMIVSQVIESVNMAPVRGRTVTFQAKMRFTVAASMTVRLGMLYLTSAGTVDTIPATFASAFGAASTDPTWGTNLTAIAPSIARGGTINGLGVDCVLTASWVNYSATFDIPTTAKNLIAVIWTNGQPAANDELNLTEMGVWEGQEVTVWTPRPQGQDYALCQRYYHKSFNELTAPAQNAGTTGSVIGYVSVAGAVAAQPIGVRFPVPMRIAPTIVIFNPSAANAFARNTSIGADSTASAGAAIAVGGMIITFTGVAGWLAGAAMAAHYTADAEL